MSNDFSTRPRTNRQTENNLGTYLFSFYFFHVFSTLIFKCTSDTKHCYVSVINNTAVQPVVHIREILARGVRVEQQHGGLDALVRYDQVKYAPFIVTYIFAG